MHKKLKPVSSRALEGKLSKAQHLLDGVQMASIDERTPAGRPIQGILAIAVNYTSRAWFAGLRPGDTILEVNNHAIKTIAQLNEIMTENKDSVLLKVHHGANRYIVINKED